MPAPHNERQALERERAELLRQGLLEPDPECRWDHVPHGGDLFPARTGACLVADGL